MAFGAAVGWGAFILPFDWIKSAGWAGTAIGFIVGGFLMSIIGFNYGIAVRAMPVTGGGVAFAMSALGRTHAFVAGSALMLGYTSIVALNASAATLILRATAPQYSMTFPLYEVAGWTVYLPEVLFSSLLILTFAYLNAKGAGLSGRFQLFSVYALIISVIIISISSGLYFQDQHPILLAPFGESQSPLDAVTVIVAFAPWAYVGFDSIPQLAGEFDFQASRVLRLIFLSIGAATAVYILMTFSTAVSVGIDYQLFETEAWPPAVAISSQMGNSGLALMLIAVTAGVLTGLNGFYAASSRVLFTMSRSRLVPTRFNKVSNTDLIPSTAIYFVAGVCLITPWFGRAALSWIVDMSSAGISLAYFYTSFFVLKMGLRQHYESKTGKRWNGKYLISGFIGCTLSVGFLLLLLLPNTPASLGKESYTALLVWTGIAISFFVFYTRNALPSED
ncbi:APC family permease [Corynebacterium gottingense]|nr:APC family permease [Corynebacterium gottingense]